MERKMKLRPTVESLGETKRAEGSKASCISHHKSGVSWKHSGHCLSGPLQYVHYFTGRAELCTWWSLEHFSGCKRNTWWFSNTGRY